MQRRSSNVIVCVSLVFGVALMASCSSGSKSADSTTTQAPTTSSTAAPMPKAAYVAAANALCRTMNTRTAALGNPGSDPTKIAEVGGRTAAIMTATLQKLRQLRPPAGDEAVVNAAYAKADALA